ncbi:unnamed protein product [Adineta steineri]|uniref:Uncharacterized protein n=1 Tax=Adineta steineri TaxID=433720 RepID=A0A813MMJ1_9BILA|nr:unnamed protein product [Adineta steineri]CAF3966054.1 unnamed protein product [Adineta steineri]
MSGSGRDTPTGEEAKDITKTRAKYQISVMENCPNGTVVGLIPTNSSNYRMILLDDAHGRFIINSKGEIIVSVFILFFFVNYNSKYYIIIWTELYIFLF